MPPLQVVDLLFFQVKVGHTQSGYSRTLTGEWVDVTILPKKWVPPLVPLESYGTSEWVRQLVKKLDLDFTIRPRGRPRKINEQDGRNK